MSTTPYLGVVMKSVFNPRDVADLIGRIDKLTASSPPSWGRMTVSQMLAHCNVTYELAYESKHPRPNPLMQFILRLVVKPMVVGEKPYPHSGRTAPVFVITGDRDFAAEKARLVGYLNKTLALGTSHFDQKESHALGRLTASEWNILFSKHLDHHLTQFGA